MLVGEKLGRYEIVRMIGAGGMGEVFLAKDNQLGREVALKVLLPEFCLDEDRVKRFMYEARAVSALNHPGIITIHEIVESEDRLFIATEFVDGETVREKIEEKSLDLYQAVAIAEQVADALAVAHDAKIAHRDVKPENIMVRGDGIAKVLDFGLAKPHVADGSDPSHEHLLVKTQPGLVIGSVRYMSPEQARGKETDGRTDIWSLGVVLYEMITGETPFDGETISDQLAALIHSEPKPLSEIPPQLDEIVGKCLQKDYENRYESIKHLAKDLRRLRLELERSDEKAARNEMADTIALPRQNTSESATLIHRTISSDNTTGINLDGQNPTVESKPLRFSRIMAVAGVALAALFLFAGWYSISAWFGGETLSFDTIRVSRLTTDGSSRKAAVSPDGKLVAFVEVKETGSRLNVRQVETGGEVEIVEESAAAYKQPVFSPDGNFVYFVGTVNGVGTLFRVSALGGEVREILTDVDSRPAISPDGTQLAFFRHDPTEGGDRVFVVGTAGENPSLLAESKDLGFDRVVDLFWSADGERVTVAGLKLSGQPTTHTQLITLNASTKKIVDDAAVEVFSRTKWTPARGFQSLSDGSGFIFIGKLSPDEAMQVWHLDVSSERVRPITTDTSDYDAVSASVDGKTIIATKAEWISGLMSYDPATKQLTQIKPDSNQHFGFKGIERTSNDHILYASRDGKDINLYSVDPATGDDTKLTSEVGYNMQPVSSSKDGTIVFVSNRQGFFGIWKMDKDGKNAVQLTNVKDGADVSPVLINEGKSILFVREMNDGGLARLMKVSIDGGEVTELLPKSETSNMHPSVSRDGQQVAYVAVSFNKEAAELNSSIRFGKVEGESIKFSDRKLDTKYNEMYSWSPSNDSITRLKSDGGRQLWEVPLEGGKEKQLTSLSGGMIRSFVWSKDGSKLFIVKGISRSDLVLIRSGDSE